MKPTKNPHRLNKKEKKSKNQKQLFVEKKKKKNKKNITQVPQRTNKTARHSKEGQNWSLASIHVFSSVFSLIWEENT